MTTSRETLKQYTDRCVREIAQEYGITMTEVRSCYSPNFFFSEWFGQIQRDAAGGQVIDARTLDSLDPRTSRYRILHDYPRAIPEDYVPVEVRREQRGRRKLVV